MGRGAAVVVALAVAVLGCGGSSDESRELEDGGGDSRVEGAAVPAGLDPDAGIAFSVEAKGDLEFQHKGGVLCEVYENELLISFLQADDPFLGYEIRVEDFSGSGSYDGAVALERRGASSAGPVGLEATVEEGGPLPLITGSFSGTFSGALGSSSLAGTFQCASDLGDPSAAVATPSGAWIEYEVSGDASAKLREPEVMVCSRGEAGVLLARSLGAWTVDIETETSGWGEVGARFTLSAPTHLAELRNAGTDPRFRGSGRVVLEEKGVDRFGFPDVEGRFEADGLTSDGGHDLNLSGTFRCGVM
jgi:hypothetical protein